MPHATILVADYDPALRELLKDLLTTEGYRVITVAPPADLVTLATQIRVQLVLLDVRPQDAAAPAQCQVLSARPAGPVVVILSTDKRVLAAAPTWGAVATLVKPFAVDTVVQLVAQWVRPGGDPGATPTPGPIP